MEASHTFAGERRRYALASACAAIMSVVKIKQTVERLVRRGAPPLVRAFGLEATPDRPDDEDLPPAADDAALRALRQELSHELERVAREHPPPETREPTREAAGGRS